MKNKAFKRTIALILALISLVSTIVVPINVSAANDYWIDVTSDVYLHSEPYKDSPKTDAVYVGETYRVIDECTNSFGNLWFKTELGYLYSGHTKKHTKHVAIMCGPGSTSYEFIDPDNHNKVVYSGDDICGCGAKCGEGTYTRKKENHFFENKVCVSCGYQAVYQTETFSEPVYIVIVDNNTPIYAEPTRYSLRKGTLNNEDTTKSTGKITNMYNNVWFALDSGGFVYSDHIADHIHKGVKSSAFPTNTTYNSIDENKHHIIKSYDKLCSCNFKVGSYSEESDERHNFDSNNKCNDCTYQRPVSIMLPETTTTTEPSTEPESKFTPQYANTVCIETATIKGEKIDSYTESHLNSHSYVEVYEKLCPTCGISYSEGHNSFSTYESEYYVDSVTEDHFTDTNEFGESVCTICGFNVTRALLNKDDALMQIHLSLGTLGISPFVGQVFDAIDAALYLLEGEYAEAGLSAMSLVPYAGIGSGVSRVTNTASDYIRSIERRKDLSKLVDKGIGSIDDILIDGQKGYGSFASFKYHNGGRAGDGKAWHHIVEQVQGKASRSGFSSELINNPANLIPLTNEEHKLITRYYNSVYDAVSGMKVRDYMSSLSYEEQYEFGLKAMKNLGILP